MALDDRSTIRRSADVVSRVLDGEAVLLDLKEGIYFGLNEVGTFLWEQIAEGATLSGLRAQLVAEFDVDEPTADRDLQDLVAELRRRGLVEVDGR